MCLDNNTTKQSVFSHHLTCSAHPGSDALDSNGIRNPTPIAQQLEPFRVLLYAELGPPDTAANALWMSELSVKPGMHLAAMQRES